jgi:hypothetical protein
VTNSALQGSRRHPDTGYEVESAWGSAPMNSFYGQYNSSSFLPEVPPQSQFFYFFLVYFRVLDLLIYE